MKVLILHNILWAHYKSLVFDALNEISQKSEDFELLVVQTARTERSRISMGNTSSTEVRYPYKLIGEGVLEDVSLKQRILGMLSAIREFKPDVVNITGYYDLAFWVVLFYCKLHRIKLVLSNESTAVDHIRNGLKEKIKSIFVRQFDGFFNFGSLSAQYMLSLGAQSNQLLVEKNCVDNATIRTIYDDAKLQAEQTKQNQQLKKYNLIFVGRLISFKNLSFLIKAFGLAKSKLSNEWGLIILGDGEDKAKLENLTKEQNVEDINFFPGVGWQEVPRYLALADVLVLPSYSEPWGLVVNEAMACAMPVIVSENCGCAADIVKDGINGFTFNPYDINHFEEILIAVMNDITKLEKMGKESERIIAEYTPQKVAEEMYNGFCKCTSLSYYQDK
ncbi:glycosyltransferase family 4 protein [Cellulophaga sp. BC115SP]|uniref:glycosyltransferase family 4 protein n=1 Tax=Cellulophaga sp. BC115SP TaxID=2683263 RepID=UPI001411C8AE|nr:glycosyltransferase family 4 protein [Cellulophaga sp. BC115SP]NBB30771.1 glycosyltransferase [Cellulophaga sp. BC115SP]